MDWLPIIYRDFYDVPRAFAVAARGGWLLFDCQFDSATDEYRSDYSVYSLAAPPPAEGPWTQLASAGRERGRVPVSSVVFDETKRKFVSEESIASLLYDGP